MASSDPRSNEPRLVSSGTFRLDRARALEKLAEFRVPATSWFLRYWVRAAVASGATGITIETPAARLVKVGFDGALIELEEADPASCLFADAPPPRLRNLAWGILAAQRRGTRWVRVTSGAAGARRTALFDESGLTLDNAAESAGNLVEAELDSPLAGDWAGELADVCRAVPAPVSIRGVSLAPATEEDGYLERREGRRIFLRPTPRLEESRVDASQWGVAVEPLNRKGALYPVSGFVDDPALSLDASQGKVVRNDALAAAREAVETAAERMTLSLLETQAERVAEFRRWASEMEGSLPPSTLVHAAPDLPPDLAEAARINEWLLELRRRSRKLPAGVAAALKRAPIPEP